jgi:hypothetical protein
MKHLKITLAIWCISIGFAHAQKYMQPPKFQTSSGIGLVMADSSFSINFRFRMQNRFGFSSDEAQPLSPQEFDMRVRRLRLRMDGFMLDPRLTWNLQLSFTRADQDWDNSLVPNVLRDAMIHYKMNRNFTLSMGLGKLPGNRQRVVSSGEQQFVDRSVVNAALTLDRDYGITAAYLAHIGKSQLVMKAVVSSGEGRGVASSKEFSNTSVSDAGLAYTGRVEFLPFGPFSSRGDYFEGDLLREAKPKLSMAATLHHNERAIRRGGQLGVLLFEPRSFRALHADMVFKYRGFAYSAEYLNRIMAGNDSAITRKGSELSWVYTGWGMNHQMSYCFKSNWELAARYSELNPDRQIWNTKDGFQQRQYAVGVSKYLNKHRVKCQSDLTWDEQFNPANGVKKKGSFIWRFQVELGI